MTGAVARKSEGVRARLVDGVLALHCVCFLVLYATDAALTLDWSILRRPVELYVLMVGVIMLRVHWPDYRLHGCKHSFALWRDHRHVILPFFGLVALGILTSLRPAANIAYDEGKAVFILAYRFVQFFAVLSVGVFLVKIGWRRALILVLLVLLGSIFYDTAYPGTFSSVASRAGGFQENPNVAAIALVMMLAMVVRYDRIHLPDLLLILVTFIGLFATLSRGGQLQFLLFLANYLYFTGRGRRLEQLALLPVVVIVMTVVGGFAITYLTSSSEMFSAENAQRRLATFSMDNSTVYATDDARLNLVPQYMMLIDHNMLLGYGSGFSRSLPLGPHNTYLDFWVNNGFLGLLLYVWLLLGMLALTWSRKFWPGFVFVQISLLAGMFTHDVIQLGVFLVLSGLAMSLSWVLDPRRAPSRSAYRSTTVAQHPAIAS